MCKLVGIDRDLHQIPFTFTRSRENVSSTDWEGFIRGLQETKRLSMQKISIFCIDNRFSLVEYFSQGEEQ